jgi:hypothetical protein
VVVFKLLKLPFIIVILSMSWNNKLLKRFVLPFKNILLIVKIQFLIVISLLITGSVKLLSEYIIEIFEISFEIKLEMDAFLIPPNTNRDAY